jgi:hypothetical protein
MIILINNKQTLSDEEIGNEGGTWKEGEEGTLKAGCCILLLINPGRRWLALLLFESDFPIVGVINKLWTEFMLNEFEGGDSVGLNNGFKLFNENLL